MTVEVTYCGKDCLDDNEIIPEDLKIILENLLEKMDWVVNLRSLVLVKHGNFTNTLPDHKNLVDSSVLYLLVKWIFSASHKPVSLRRLWTQDLIMMAPVVNISFPSLPMTTYVLDEDMDVYFENDTDAVRETDWFATTDIVITRDERFNHLEHLAMIEINGPLTNHPRDYLPNLKYARVNCRNDNGCRQVLREKLV